MTAGACRTMPVIEVLVTTVDEAGTVNVAPMGVEWDGGGALVLRPFVETTTWRNLQQVPAAVVHLVDDVRLFAEAAIGRPGYPTAPARRVRGAVLEAACAWREVALETIEATPPRARCVARVVHGEHRRDFLGFNRARHAVLEAAILATRLHLRPAAQVQDELGRLRVLVDKTAGLAEREAWDRLAAYIASRLEVPA